MTAPCEWCAKHRESLRQMEDDIIAIERGGNALELLASEDQLYNTSDAIKFIATQLAVIGGRLAETFSLWGFSRRDGEG
jgi:hypothetical protein